jgi:5-formyltetrahydrofolate cyclo-ligase
LIEVDIASGKVVVITIAHFQSFVHGAIGLIHADEISSEDLPREDWDIPLNAAATPDLVIRFKK